MLAAMGLRYGTEEATEFSEQVHKTIALEAYRSSVNMAKNVEHSLSMTVNEKKQSVHQPLKRS